MIGGQATRRQVLVHTAIRHGVEITRDDQRYLRAFGVNWCGTRGGVAISIRRCYQSWWSWWVFGKVVRHLLDFVHKQSNLHQLDISVLRIPAYVSIRDDEACAGLPVLKEADDRDVIFRENSIEHIVCLLQIGTLHRDGAELDEVLLDQSISVQRSAD